MIRPKMSGQADRGTLPDHESKGGGSARGDASGLRGAPGGADDPGQYERLLAPGVVAAAATAMPGRHLRLQQERAALGLRLQPRGPLGGLAVKHPRSEERRVGKD